MSDSSPEGRRYSVRALAHSPVGVDPRRSRDSVTEQELAAPPDPGPTPSHAFGTSRVRVKLKMCHRRHLREESERKPSLRLHVVAGPRNRLRRRHPVRFSNLRDLPSVVIPVIVEHRAHVHRQSDPVGPHELLEERNLCLAPQLGLVGTSPGASEAQRRESRGGGRSERSARGSLRCVRSSRCAARHKSGISTGWGASGAPSTACYRADGAAGGPVACPSSPPWRTYHDEPSCLTAAPV